VLTQNGRILSPLILPEILLGFTHILVVLLSYVAPKELLV